MSEKLLTVTDAAEAKQLQKQFTALTVELAQLEEEWIELSTELESA